MTTNDQDLTPEQRVTLAQIADTTSPRFSRGELRAAVALADKYHLPVEQMAGIVRDVVLIAEACQESQEEALDALISWPPGETIDVLLIDPDGTARLETIPCGIEGEAPVEFFALQMAIGANDLVDRACGDGWLAVAKEDFDDLDDATGRDTSNLVAESLIAKLGEVRSGPLIGTVAFLGRDSDVRRGTPSWMWRATPAWLIAMAPPLATVTAS